MVEKKHINEVSEEHEAKGGGRKAFSFKCGAEWALEEVKVFLENVKLNEFIIGKISLNAEGMRICQFEFDKDFIPLLLVAIEYGFDVLNLSPTEREELLNKKLVL